MNRRDKIHGPSLKSLSPLLLLGGVTLCSPEILLSEIQTQESTITEIQTVEEFFENLKNGRSKTILDFLADPLRSKREELLNSNRGYGSFLRKTYRDASMEVTKSKRVDERTSEVDVLFSLNRVDPPVPTRFLLKLEGGVWKISDEVKEF